MLSPLSMSLQPAVSVLKDQLAWGLSHQPSGISPDTLLQSLSTSPNTHIITDPETKQAEWLPACTQLPRGRSQERALLFAVVKIGKKIKGEKNLNVSVSPAFCFSFCKYSALFFREKLLIVS